MGLASISYKTQFPKHIVTDNGDNFVTKFVTKFVQEEYFVESHLGCRGAKQRGMRSPRDRSNLEVCVVTRKRTRVVL